MPEHGCSSLPHLMETSAKDKREIEGVGEPLQARGKGSRWEQFRLPVELNDRTFLDVGCWEGMHCAEAVRRDAAQVVGVDLCTSDDLAFNVMDIAWPLSMAWMLVVGVTVVVAGRMQGWRRFAPLLCGLWLPLGIPLQAVLGEQTGSIMFGVSAVFWLLLGYAVRGGGGHTAQAPEPAVP